MPIALSVNLNKIALIRNSREGDFPNVESFGLKSIAAGASGLTVHPRPDQRHIRPNDTRLLALMVKRLSSQEKPLEFNIEGNPFAPARDNYPGLIPLALETMPNQCTLVPDSDSQKTSDHGFDLTKDGAALAPLIAQLKNAGIRVSLFMDPDLEQIKLAKKIGADRIELYTGPFAAAYEESAEAAQAVFEQHSAAANLALELGLGVNAGHDLNLENMTLYRDLPGLQEVSIGHALTVDALFLGFDTAVAAYCTICKA
ncbi:pyridoxine 5'-phosphate synthase [Teredinibacter waterburyi]|uniref:pyridoxine 5'-phosphate synthase n=1 Tax=Teredinibacter waterburyi TaxID=1500538 RepID=UPI00165F605F|nr:pyridoxine 5'-phosphate synthase [Teredinibacter waterburyi]